MVNPKEEETLLSEMEDFILVNGKMEQDTEKENNNIQQIQKETIMMDHGMMIKKMVKAFWFLKMEKHMREVCSMD